MGPHMVYYCTARFTSALTEAALPKRDILIVFIQHAKVIKIQYETDSKSIASIFKSLLSTVKKLRAV